MADAAGPGETRGRREEAELLGEGGGRDWKVKTGEEAEEEEERGEKEGEDIGEESVEVARWEVGEATSEPEREEEEPEADGDRSGGRDALGTWSGASTHTHESQRLPNQDQNSNKHKAAIFK